MGFVTVVLLCLIPALGGVLAILVAMDAYGPNSPSSHTRGGIRIGFKRLLRAVRGA